MNSGRSNLHCKDCGRAGCCHKEEPQVVRIKIKDRGDRAYIDGWSTEHRSGSEPCDLNDAASIAKALYRLVNFLTNGEAVHIYFDE